MLSSHPLKIELHDCDEFVKLDPEDEPPVFSYGCAKFSLKDLLSIYVNNMKLRSDVFPVKKALINTENNLDLNTTARKAEKTTEKSSPYLINSTYFVISVDLAHNIEPFNEEEELKKIQKRLAEEAAKAALEAGEEPPA